MSTIIMKLSHFSAIVALLESVIFNVGDEKILQRSAESYLFVGCFVFFCRDLLPGLLQTIDFNSYDNPVGFLLTTSRVVNLFIHRVQVCTRLRTSRSEKNSFNCFFLFLSLRHQPLLLTVKRE